MARGAEGRSALKELGARECVELLATQVIGRVAVVVDGRASVFPVNYVLDHGHIVFRTDEGTKLDAARAGATVTFEVDRSDPMYHTGWSVMATGPLEAVTDPGTTWNASVGCRCAHGVAPETIGFACPSRRSPDGASAIRRPGIEHRQSRGDDRMDVLVLESESGAADATIEKLTNGGHRIFRCHEPGKPEFPCRALAGEGPCPLSDPGVDVAVTVRARPDMRPTLREDGACVRVAGACSPRCRRTRHAEPLRGMG